MPEETMQKVERIIRDLESPTEDITTRNRHIKKAYSVFPQINALPQEHREQFVTRLADAAMNHTRMHETLALISAIEGINHPANKAALEKLRTKHPTGDGKFFASISLERLIR